MPFDIPSALRVLGYVAVAGGVLGFLYMVYRSGKKKAKLKQLKEEARTHGRFHRDGEDWDRVDPIGDGMPEQPPKE